MTFDKNQLKLEKELKSRLDWYFTLQDKTMKQIKISDKLYKKINDASFVVNKSMDAMVREFLDESADVVLSGNVFEIDFKH